MTFQFPEIRFSHPASEVYGPSLPKELVDKKTAYSEGRVFSLCGCSEIGVSEVEELKMVPAPTAFLQRLIDDITVVRMNLMTGPHCYLLLGKPISEYEEDDMVQKCRQFLKNPEGMSFYEYVQSLVPPKWDYLLMHYIENAGYCQHGVSIRCAYAANP
jgi:hypothetical protein